MKAPVFPARRSTLGALPMLVALGGEMLRGSHLALVQGLMRVETLHGAAGGVHREGP